MRSQEVQTVILRFKCGAVMALKMPEGEVYTEEATRELKEEAIGRDCPRCKAAELLLAVLDTALDDEEAKAAPYN